MTASRTLKSTFAPNRRRFLKDVAATTALLAAGRQLLPQGAYAAASGPEVSGAKLGFIALTDAGPLFVAKEKGFFAKHGMPDVEVLKQSSWGTTRDNLVLGAAGNGIDGAHILTPMPYLITSGAVTQNNQPTPLSILARLNVAGQCISVGQEYAGLKLGVDATPFKAALAAKKGTGKEVKAANTFPGGTHDLWIRYWLAAGGIDPNSDIQTITVPPAQMVANMKVGTMDCFCVCEPWNHQLVNQGIGYTALTTGELWDKHPEKSFTLRTDFVEKYPKATKALLMAIMEAQMWCEDMANKEELAQICAKRNWINAPFKDVVDRMKGNFDYGNGKVVENSPFIMHYWADNASYPFRSHDLWFLTEDIRWGYLPKNTDTKALLDRVNREDLWRETAKELGVSAIPDSTSRGVETFFDGKVFDPANPSAYLESLAIKRMV
ncbi:CmpA/NrtA family ABC transporter substrate-binding protein [Chelatococcus asaccharovorans]|uniref:Nitrate/nitrite transport system substrate-binding protein n=1 Tax=Chelatococcus asaccharovorans TaxID=28210 RepID=A0A2V3UAM4_9HYPH|nr:CmpA/NrtA family ABC transporter substrate-binding protein [Chelatococcus asaccharovorans]MBS7707643.1 ABC transporter substrate-binding protein [Chelatococcus asaccharovorans]PXW55217.1 nitrate/nitrite transport system substrate-binding protein [Chelatococcus asaccharovorans]